MIIIIYSTLFFLLLLAIFFLYMFFPGIPKIAKACKKLECGYYENDHCGKPGNKVSDEMFLNLKGKKIEKIDSRNMNCNYSTAYMGFNSSKQHEVYLSDKKTARLNFLIPFTISVIALFISVYTPIKRTVSENPISKLNESVKNLKIKTNSLEKELLKYSDLKITVGSLMEDVKQLKDN